MAGAAPAVSEPADRAYRKAVNAWCFYDWANSAFFTTITTTIFQAFYINVAGEPLGSDRATNFWGFTNSATMLIVAVLAPILGAIADHSGSRKRFLGTFAGVGIIFTATLVLLGTGNWLLASALYLLARLGYAGANVFYDSLLPHVARPNDLDRVSARGYALGYLGGGLLLAVNAGMIYWLGFTRGARLSFLSVAVWWALFTLPLIRRVPEPMVLGAAGEISPVRAGFRRLRETFREIRRYRELLKFLAAFWLYNDGIGTVMTMAFGFALTLGLPPEAVLGAILAVQFIGVPCAIGFGWLARHLGTKRSILLGLVVYALICIFAFCARPFTVGHFWILACAVGLVQGGTQALSRSLFGAMSPKAKASEFFGFYNMSSKFAAILGPLLYGVVGELTKSPQWSLLSVITFFIAGGLLLLWVNVSEGVRVAREEDERLVSAAGPANEAMAHD